MKQARLRIDEALAAAETTTLDIVISATKQAWETLGEITGTQASEDIIDRIYSKFCLGK